MIDINVGLLQWFVNFLIKDLWTVGSAVTRPWPDPLIHDGGVLNYWKTTISRKITQATYQKI